jgi:hypothetical protein
VINDWRGRDQLMAGAMAMAGYWIALRELQHLFRLGAFGPGFGGWCGFEALAAGECQRLALLMPAPNPPGVSAGHDRIAWGSLLAALLNY